MVAGFIIGICVNWCKKGCGSFYFGKIWIETVEESISWIGLKHLNKLSGFLIWAGLFV